MLTFDATNKSLSLNSKQAVGERPPRYAPPLYSPVGAEAPCAAEQTAT